MQSYFEWIRSSEIIWRYYCKWDFTPEQIKWAYQERCKTEQCRRKDTHANLYDGAIFWKDWHNQNIGITSLSKAEYWLRQ